MPRQDKLRIPGINHIVIDGRLTREPDLRTTPQNKSVMDIGVAHNERKKNPKTGEWEDDVTFWDVTVFGTQADTLSRTASKGDAIVIQGRLSMDRWSDDKGEHQRVKIMANRASLMQWPEEPQTISQQAKHTQVAHGEQSTDELPY